MILALLLAFLAFLVGPLGLFHLLLGVLMFLGVPFLSLLSGDKRFARLYLWLGMWSIGRGAPTLSENGDLLWKQTSFDDLGVEKTEFGDTRKEFLDVDGALQTWLGFPFALADEVHGVLFDPRHCALGKRKYEHDLEGTSVVPATDDEASKYKVRGWMPGVFELPKDTHELVELSMARQLVDGSERSDDPQRVEKWYQYAVAPDGNRQSIARILAPVMAFLAVFAGLWLISDQMSKGGGGGPTITGSLVLLGMLGGVRDVDWRRGFATLFIVAAPIAWLALMAVVFGTVTAVFAGLAMAIGVFVLPLLTLASRPSKLLSGGLSRYIYMKLGLFGWQRPVWKWTPRRYELVEYDDLEWTDDVAWYSMLGHVVGFTYEPQAESWQKEHIDADEIAARQEQVTEPARADGGALSTDGTEERDVSGVSTNIPSGYTRWPGKRRGLYGAYVPRESRLDDDSLYVRTGIALSRLLGAATGDKTERRLNWSREKYGDGNWGLSDSTLLWATLGATVIAAGLGTWVFFL
jgi:hypothetical protein